MYYEFMGEARSCPCAKEERQLGPMGLIGPLVYEVLYLYEIVVM